MEHTQETPHRKKRRFISKHSLFLLTLSFTVTMSIFYVMHFRIIAATCMTKAQVQSDSRCLYIYSGKIYQKDSRSSPHHGHACGTDVTSVLPSSHSNSAASFLTPNYVADICPATTNTPTPTPTTPPSQSTPTLTPAPGSSTKTFSITLCHHGLGNCGDNANPQGGNTSPKHTSRNVTVSVLDNNEQVVTSGQGTVNYDATAKKFIGTITIPNLSTGAYLVRVSSPGFLPKKYPGFINVSSNATITAPEIALVNGNINNDTQLDVLDYNLLQSCYGTKATSPSCTNAQAADLNDDGTVGGGDFNLLLREFSVQKGQ